MSTLYVDNLEPNLGSGVIIPGHVVQFQSAILGRLDTLSSSFAGLGSVSITPTSTSSKIFILIRNHTYLSSVPSGGLWRGALTRLSRGSTILLDEGAKFGSPAMHTSVNTDRGMWENVLDYYDIPATTSSVTYQVDGASRDGYNVDFNNPSYGPQGRITVMEIAQ